MKSRMEMIYIDSADQACKTGVGAIMDSPLETWAAFNSAKALEVPIEHATFLLDYYNRKGDLCQTIALSEAGYRQITGEPVLSEAEYHRIDTEYWSEARATMRKKAA